VQKPNWTLPGYMRPIEGPGGPGSKIAIYFLPILDYHISQQPGCRGAAGVQVEERRPRVEASAFNGRTISGGVPPETRAGKIFCPATI
jgi:hypothetical protein